MESIFIQKVLAGQTDAFHYFVNKYKTYAFALARSILKNDHLAEEAAQEAFIKAFEKLSSFKQASSFQTWFGRIVINESFRTAQKNNHQNHLCMEEIPENQIATIEETVRAIVEKEQKHYISEAFKQLPPQESLALELFYIKEHSIREIKALTGWSISKVKMLLVRGRKNFYARLNVMLQTEKKEIL
jgi:RNA polymerase sigma-70 factor (ECF subfamily)